MPHLDTCMTFYPFISWKSHHCSHCCLLIPSHFQPAALTDLLTPSPGVGFGFSVFVPLATAISACGASASDVSSSDTPCSDTPPHPSLSACFHCRLGAQDDLRLVISLLLLKVPNLFHLRSALTASHWWLVAMLAPTVY